MGSLKSLLEINSCGSHGTLSSIDMRYEIISKKHTSKFLVTLKKWWLSNESSNPPTRAFLNVVEKVLREEEATFSRFHCPKLAKDGICKPIEP